MLIVLALLVGAPAGPSNLDFASNKLTNWENDGFRLVKRQITSSDRDGKGRTASLNRTVRVPADARQLRCAAASYRPADLKAAGTLDVLVETEKGKAIPRIVFDGSGWKPAKALLPPDDGALREYAWNVSAYAGQRVRIRVVDDDDRPRCHVASTGFEFLNADDANSRGFATAVRRLERTQKLPRMLRYDSTHFMALSNAGAAQTEYRLYNCETMYAGFLKHFKHKGFALAEPTEKLMVAVFSTQDGFDSYLGRSPGQAVTGVYEPGVNRLAVYDFGTNKAFVDSIKKMESEAMQGSTDLEKQAKIVAFGKWVKTRRDDVNLSTMMHEAAHQMAFNAGLMNRNGDVPVWAAEGLATYCEPSATGQWQGIGAPNAQRLPALKAAVNGERKLLSLRALVRNDDWLRKGKTDDALMGYSQSWALFRMLMEERPAAVKKYLALIHDRRTSDHRLTDFGACFGTDLAAMEKKHVQYVMDLAR